MYRKSELWEAYQKINIRDAISVIDQVGGPQRDAINESYWVLTFDLCREATS